MGMEYDGLFLDWESLEDNFERRTARRYFLQETVFKGDAYFNLAIQDKGRPEILRELNLQDFYKIHADYYIHRLTLKDDPRLYQQYITNAVTAILIDSYAHNISAHALSTLSWWFYQRADIMLDEELHWDSLFELLERDTFYHDNHRALSFLHDFKLPHLLQALLSFGFPVALV